MKIAYICADFGVPVFGYKGASIHVSEMVMAMWHAGHSLYIISPALNIEVENNNQNNVGEEVFSPKADDSESMSHDSRSDYFEPVEFDLGGLTYVSVLPKKKHLQFSLGLKRLEGFSGVKTHLRQEIRNLLYNFSLYDGLLEYLQNQQVDFIYERYTLFIMAGIHLAKKLGVPHILEVNAPLAYEQEKMRGLEMKEFAREMEQRIFRETDRVIVVSKELQEFVKSCGVPKSRITVLPNGVNSNRFVPAVNGQGVKEKYKLNDKIVIGFVGSLKSWHGTLTLLEAFHRLYRDDPALHLMIVGNGPEFEILEKYIIDHQLYEAVTLTGKIQYYEIPQYLGVMDITAAPYIPIEKFYFSPIKIFEYMAMGKPVVGAKIGQVEEIITDGETGLLFEPGNIGQLADTLKKLIDDPQLRQSIGEKARAWVINERTWDKNAREVLKMAQRLIQKKKV